MKYLLFCAVLIFLYSFQPLHAQKKKRKDEVESFYLLKQDWSVAPDLASAVYFMQVIKDNDSSYICRYYNKNGPMVKQESFKNEELTIPNGRFCWYNNDGFLDSVGQVTNGHKDGYWEYYSNQKRYLAIRYKNRQIVEKLDYDAGIYTDSSGTQSSLKEKFTGDSLLSDNLKPVQVAAKFNGDWKNYINKNLRTPERLGNVMGKGRYVVAVSFLIDKEGNVKDVFLMKSSEWSADTEALRVFQSAPKWIPAQQNGTPVAYRQKEALTFVVDVQ